MFGSINRLFAGHESVGTTPEDTATSELKKEEAGYEHVQIETIQCPTSVSNRSTQTDLQPASESLSLEKRVLRIEKLTEGLVRRQQKYFSEMTYHSDSKMREIRHALEQMQYLLIDRNSCQCQSRKQQMAELLIEALERKIKATKSTVKVEESVQANKNTTAQSFLVCRQYVEKMYSANLKKVTEVKIEQLAQLLLFSSVTLSVVCKVDFIFGILASLSLLSMYVTCRHEEPLVEVGGMLYDHAKRDIRAISEETSHCYKLMQNWLLGAGRQMYTHAKNDGHALRDEVISVFTCLQDSFYAVGRSLRAHAQQDVHALCDELGHCVALIKGRQNKKAHKE